MSERYEILLMKAVDGEITHAEHAELEALLDADPERRAEYHDMTAIKSLTDNVVQRILADADLEPIRPSAPTRHILTLSWLLILSGLALILGWTAYETLTEPDVPLAVSVGLGASLLGSVVIVGYLLTLRVRGRDPYEEIDL